MGASQAPGQLLPSNTEACNKLIFGIFSILTHSYIFHAGYIFFLQGLFHYCELRVVNYLGENVFFSFRSVFIERDLEVGVRKDRRQARIGKRNVGYIGNKIDMSI